jgi:hypothetical protein
MKGGKLGAFLWWVAFGSGIGIGRVDGELLFVFFVAAVLVIRIGGCFGLNRRLCSSRKVIDFDRGFRVRLALAFWL